MSDIDNDFFEKVILYKSLTDEKYLGSIIDYIKPHFFKDKRIKEIFTIISDFYIKHNSVPTSTEVKTYLTNEKSKESFKEIINEIKDIDKNLNDDELYSNTEKFLKEKAVFTTMMDVAEKVSKNEIDTSDILKKFESACSINLSVDLGLEILSNSSILIDELNKAESFISTGYPWLDQRIGGGLQENGRSLYVFAGETNIGKSIFLANLAVNIAKQNKAVLVISLEMPELIYAKRLSSNITKIPVFRLKGEQEQLKSGIEEFVKKTPNAKIFIKEFPPSTVSPLQISAFIKKFIAKGIKIDAIVLDYLNLVHSPQGNNSYERVKYVTEKIRALSYIFNCPIISATQLNRSGYNESDPSISTISESIGLAATADVLLSIFQTDEERELGIIHLGMMKNRFGPNFGNILLRIDYPTLTIIQDDSINDTDESNSITNTLKILSENN
jgi:replicative DNA helicase